MLDFLKEIVEGVPDPSAGGTVDLDGENADTLKKKRGKGKKGAPLAGSTDPAPTPKKRKKKGDVQAQGAVVQAPEAEVEQEGKSEQEGDVAMDDADEYDEGHSGPSFKPGPVGQPEDAEEDGSYAPKR
jgi:hypothetical protein